MERRQTRHTLRLLASTSLIALSLAVAPVALQFDADTLLGKAAHADSSCFVAGTLVLMADGSTQPIETVAVGDRVMGPRGGANRVVAIETPRLGGRALYAFNGGAPFVTAEHPFMARAGWKAIDPAATLAENAGLRVGRLAIGDLVAVSWGGTAARSVGNLALAEAEAPAIAYVRLAQLEAADADPATVVFNLLLDGDHSYFANGFLAHNKGGGDGDGGGGGGSHGGSHADGGSNGSGAEGPSVNSGPGSTNSGPGSTNSWSNGASGPSGPSGRSSR